MTDRAINRFASTIDRVLDELETEVERAETIVALRTRERRRGRSGRRLLGKNRRAQLTAMLDELKPLLERWDGAMALHRDPVIVREALRFERRRASS